MKRLFILTLLLVAVYTVQAEGNLSKSISIHVIRQRLASVMEQISNKGTFYFSYNSKLIKRDSLVSIDANNKKVKDILDQLFNNRFEYRESGNYVIIRPQPVKLTIVTKPVPVADKYYTIKGYVLDGQNGVKLPSASIYEKSQLIGSLSDYNGFFNLKLKSKYSNASLSVSKEFYRDTTVFVNPNISEEIMVTLYPNIQNDVVVAPEDFLLPDSVKEERLLADTLARQEAPKDSTAIIESRFLGRWFVSAGQKVQSMNLGDWFTERPFQFSLTPGLSTHGKMSGQVVNNFSINLLGGYTGGLKGFEIGGLFNINRKDAIGFQAAGWFNHSGGNQVGFQVSGISNSVLESTQGFQAAGIANFSRTWMNGFQAAGVVNFIGDQFKGFQAGGVYNHVGKDMAGIQVSGVANFVTNNLKGIQIAGVFNYTKHNRGLQIGLINYADTSDGYSIGLINIVHRGYHKWYIGTDETMDLTTSIKTGNRKLYSILLGGMNLEENNKLFAFGYGIGTEWVGTRRFALSTDITSQYLYLGSWDYLNLLNRFSLNLHFKVGKGFAIYGGPSFNAYYSDQNISKPGYAVNIPDKGYQQFNWDGNWRGWGGWHMGVVFF
jgi:hypothetical protein